MKIYCGTKTVVPEGYAGRGTQYECLRKGFGAGYYARNRDRTYSMWHFALVLVVVCIIIGGLVWWYIVSRKREISEDDGHIG